MLTMSGICSRPLGMDVVVAGYEFAHRRQTYEGRRVLSSIVHTGQSKVLADIHYKRDPNVVSPYDAYSIQKKKETIPRLMDYEGLLPHMKDGQIMIDDYSHHECERLVKDLGIDLFCSGIKDKYVFQKMHIPSRQGCCTPMTTAAPTQALAALSSLPRT